MDIRKLQRAIVDGLEDVKGHDIVVLNTEHLSPLFERVIVVSGTSNRQTKALASSVRETVKSRGMTVLATEGADNGEWIIVDCGAAVAHIMQPEIRDYYRLEELWGGKPVHMKMGAAQVAPSARRQPGAPQAVAAPAATPAKAPRKRAAAPAKAAAKKTGPAVKKPAPAAKRAPVRAARPRKP
ncbi:MAG: ribosome silencing factor [Aquabacterium sp.]